ncbi:hypothetical protein R3I93_022295 [Phoxinus phoxinus]|uniref:Uncharacterized protein n=1 Tax=Phoxinus phoxinus TaxID=58324 RepID=A0AAN9C9K5_9TELE
MKHQHTCFELKTQYL